MNWRWVYLAIGFVFGIIFAVAFGILAAYGQTPPSLEQQPTPALQQRFDEIEKQIWASQDLATIERLNVESRQIAGILTARDMAELADNTRSFAALLPAMVQASGGLIPAQYRLEGGMALPDRAVTPGAVDPAAVADLSGAPHLVDGVERNVCAKDFRTAPIRKQIKNFAKLKRQACQEYSVAKCDSSVEGDHLISLEIGGCADCVANIWPQPMDEARIKDHRVEDVLPGLVCQGKIKLADAQQCIAADWIACEQQIEKLQGGAK